MPDSTITGLPSYPAAIGTDVLVIVDVTNNITKEITKDDFLSGVQNNSNTLVSSQLWKNADGNIVLMRIDNTVQFYPKDLGSGLNGFIESELWKNADGLSVLVTVDNTSQFAYEDLGIAAGGVTVKFWINTDNHIIKVTMDSTSQFAYKDLGI